MYIYIYMYIYKYILNSQAIQYGGEGPGGVLEWSAAVFSARVLLPHNPGIPLEPLLILLVDVTTQVISTWDLSPHKSRFMLCEELVWGMGGCLFLSWRGPHAIFVWTPFYLDMNPMLSWHGHHAEDGMTLATISGRFRV